MSESRFYFVVQCPKCDEDIYYGPVMSLLEHKGLMAVPFDMMAQTRVDCDCDAVIWFGDFDETMYVEGGDDDDE